MDHFQPLHIHEPATAEGFKMKIQKTQIALCLHALLLALFVSNNAKAENSAKFVLTATTESASEEIRPGVTRYKTFKFKITNKEMLQLLALTYPAASLPNVILSVNDTGSFVILDDEGSTLQTVSPSVLVAGYPGTLIGQGTRDTLTPELNLSKVWTGTIVVFDYDPTNTFELRGGMTGRYRVGATTSILFTLNVAGAGVLESSDCFIAGKVILRYAD